MKKAGIFMETVATYRKHGWELRSALLQPATRAEFDEQELELLQGVTVRESEVDALWFSRPSHQKREAWELRLLAQTQYALFETFEQDEPEEDRDDVKLEMEARMREFASGSVPPAIAGESVPPAIAGGSNSRSLVSSDPDTDPPAIAGGADY